MKIPDNRCGCCGKKGANVQKENGVKICKDCDLKGATLQGPWDFDALLDGGIANG